MQVNFYLTTVDRLLKQPEDNPTGMILCKEDQSGLNMKKLLMN
ncbi:MAG: DUF1016 family protein [Parachlamydiaceae bacterium]|nr:DUF1016 family protein [Parachlamydiaceae bacterium]